MAYGASVAAVFCVYYFAFMIKFEVDFYFISAQWV